MSSSPAGAPGPTSRTVRLADALRNATQSLHGRAERTGIVRELLSGTATRPAYALYLRSLLAAYAALERALERHRNAPGVERIALSGVYRVDALKSDLRALVGDDWASALPLLPPAERYAARIDVLANQTPQLLVAHAYVRYLGDLSGGRMLRRVLGASLGLGSDALRFYVFPEVGDETAFRSRFRDAIDLAGEDMGVTESTVLAPLVDEGMRAFEHNIAISEAVVCV